MSQFNLVASGSIIKAIVASTTSRLLDPVIAEEIQVSSWCRLYYYI